MRELAVPLVGGIHLNPILMPHFRIRIWSTQHLKGCETLLVRPLPRLRVAVRAETHKCANAFRTWIATSILDIQRHHYRSHTLTSFVVATEKLPRVLLVLLVTRRDQEIDVGACRVCACERCVSARILLSPYYFT